MVSERNKKIIRVLSLSGILLFIMVLFTQTLGLFQTGFESEEILQQFFFYIGPGLGFLIGILIFWFIELLILKGDSEYGNGIGFASQGEFPSPKFFKKFSNFHLFFLSLIIFSILGFLIFISGEQGTFTGLHVLPQQFSPTSSLLFSGALVPISENLGAGFLIAFLFYLTRKMARMGNWKRANYVILVYAVFPLLTGVVGVMNHILRGYTETQLWVVFIFWTIGGFITILTGNIIPFIVMHFDNNFFYDVKRLFVSDVITTYFFISITILIVLYILYLFWIRKRKKKNINNI